MEDQRERVADASLAFVRRHHLRRLALSLVALASLHHLSTLHLPPWQEGKEDRRPLKGLQTARRGRLLQRRLALDVVVGVTDADRALDFVGVAVADDIDADGRLDFTRVAVAADGRFDFTLVAVDADRAFDSTGVAVAFHINASKRLSSSTSKWPRLSSIDRTFWGRGKPPLRPKRTPAKTSPSRRDALSSMQFATIKGLRIEKYTLQSQNWRESAKTNKTTRLITARRNMAHTIRQEPN
jgi:hypothetical protein